MADVMSVVSRLLPLAAALAVAGATVLGAFCAVELAAVLRAPGLA